MVFELLGMKFGTPRDNDALAFAASIAIETKDYKILDYMISSLNFYGERLYSSTGTWGKKTVLTYILQNDDYLIKKGLKEIKHIFSSLWSVQDKDKEQIIFYIIELNTNNNNDLIEIKNNLFDLVSNTEIQINSKYDNNDIREYIKGHILVHLLNKKFYHGVNHLLRNQKYKPTILKSLSGGVFDQIRRLLPSLDEINGEGFELLEKFIQEVKPDK